MPSLVGARVEVYLSTVLKLLVFDLDGTLADTRMDLCNSVNHALEWSGRAPLPLPTVVSAIGDGARNLILRCLRASDGREPDDRDLDALLSAFLEHYRIYCLEHSSLYPGVENSLSRLSAYRKAVLTNKPLEPTLRILSGLGIDGFFGQVLGGDNPHGPKPDPAALRHILAAENVRPEEAAMIGDGTQDLQVARRAGVHFLAFLNGMGSRLALADQGIENGLESMADLPQALAALNSRPPRAEERIS